MFQVLHGDITAFESYLVFHYLFLRIQDELCGVYKDRCLIRKQIIDCEAAEKELKIKLFKRVCSLFLVFFWDVYVNCCMTNTLNRSWQMCHRRAPIISIIMVNFSQNHDATK